MIKAERLRRVVRADGSSEAYREANQPARPEHADDILAIAALMANADGALFQEETAAFRVLAAEVRKATGGPPGETELAAYVRDDAEASALLAEHASRLRGSVSRAIAYKVAVAIANCDLAAHEKEWEVDEALVEALGLSPDEADALTAEVHEALAGDESDP